MYSDLLQKKKKKIIYYIIAKHFFLEYIYIKTRMWNQQQYNKYKTIHIQNLNKTICMYLYFIIINNILTLPIIGLWSLNRRSRNDMIIIRFVRFA